MTYLSASSCTVQCMIDVNVKRQLCVPNSSRYIPVLWDIQLMTSMFELALWNIVYIYIWTVWTAEWIHVSIIRERFYLAINKQQTRAKHSKVRPYCALSGRYFLTLSACKNVPIQFISVSHFFNIVIYGEYAAAVFHTVYNHLYSIALFV